MSKNPQKNQLQGSWDCQGESGKQSWDAVRGWWRGKTVQELGITVHVGYASGLQDSLRGNRKTAIIDDLRTVLQLYAQVV